MNCNIIGMIAMAKTTDGGTYSEGEVIAFCDVPQVKVRRSDGSTFWWRADLCEFSDKIVTVVLMRVDSPCHAGFVVYTKENCLQVIKLLKEKYPDCCIRYDEELKRVIYTGPESNLRAKKENKGPIVTSGSYGDWLNRQ